MSDRLTTMYHPSAHPEGVFTPYVAINRLYPGYWSGPDYSRAMNTFPVTQTPFQNMNEMPLDGLGALSHERAEEIEHAVLGMGLLAAVVSVIGCKKGWKLWTVGLGAFAGAAAGFGYTKMKGAAT